MPARQQAMLRQRCLAYDAKELIKNYVPFVGPSPAAYVRFKLAEVCLRETYRQQFGAVRRRIERCNFV